MKAKALWTLAIVAMVGLCVSATAGAAALVVVDDSFDDGSYKNDAAVPESPDDTLDVPWAAMPNGSENGVSSGRLTMNHVNKSYPVGALGTLYSWSGDGTTYVSEAAQGSVTVPGGTGDYVRLQLQAECDRSEPIWFGLYNSNATYPGTIEGDRYAGDDDKGYIASLPVSNQPAGQATGTATIYEKDSASDDRDMVFEQDLTEKASDPNALALTDRDNPTVHDLEMMVLRAADGGLDIEVTYAMAEAGTWDGTFGVNFGASPNLSAHIAPGDIVTDTFDEIAIAGNPPNDPTTDNYRLEIVTAPTQVIPEPVSALAVMLGLGAVGRYVRRRRS
jgi:hypothetical protein